MDEKRTSRLSGPIASLFSEPTDEQSDDFSSLRPPHVRNATAWRPRSKVYRDLLLKIAYLTCATILTTTLIVECILLHLVVMPYRYETGFTPTECTYVRARVILPSVRCENRCSKDRSTFQCVQITVAYVKDRRNYTANLFDNIATYQNYHSLGCSTNSCQRQDENNQAWVHNFHRALRRSVRFPCYINEKHVNEALLHKFYDPVTLFNTVFWPSALLALSVLCLLPLWLYDRCRVWGDDNTVIA